MERLGEADWARGRGRGGEDSQNTLLATVGTKIGKLKETIRTKINGQPVMSSTKIKPKAIDEYL
jgi:hypothetical protein